MSTSTGAQDRAQDQDQDQAQIKRRIVDLKLQIAELQDELRKLEVSQMDSKDQLRAYFHDNYEDLCQEYGNTAYLVICGTYTDPSVYLHHTYASASASASAQHDPYIIASTYSSQI